ncbi:MAG: hypothetical protein IJA89_08500 [Clostridia bacterium]|nr:hypothetical protein [Clostridia bacterium]
MKARFKKVIAFLCGVDYRHYICVGITIGIVLLCPFFPNAFGRVIDGLWDICTSIAYFCVESVNTVSEWISGTRIIDHNITATVTTLPTYTINTGGGSSSSALPSEWSQFKIKWATYWRTWANGRNFLMYLAQVLSFIVIFGQILVWFVVLLCLLKLWLKRFLRVQPDTLFDKYGKAINANVDSKALKRHKRFTNRYYFRAKWRIKDFISFIRNDNTYWKVWLCLTAFYFNAFTIAFEFIAFVLYFLASFDLSGLYRQFYKLAMDLSPLLNVSTIAWIIGGFAVFSIVCRGIADKRLRHYINYGRGFGSTRSLFTIICATVGAGKTTMLVQMGLFDILNHRDRAFEDMLKNDLKFPHFPWINLEKSMQRAIESGIVRDLKTTRDFIKARAAYFEKHPTQRNCFDYDFEHYGFTFNDSLKVSTVWNVIESYAQQYFIYIMRTSMLANFGVRLDDIKQDLGHFPIWNSDFLNRDPRLMDAYSRHCKILDFNALRIGMKMVSDNEYVYNFEFGTILITEIGKELMNDKELRDMGVKFIALEANQRNDGMINEIKLIRHSATVDGFPYVVIRSDEQRPESLGANARDLFEIVHIDELSERKIALPCFSLTELLYAAIFNRFAQLYYKYRFVRSDNTLPMHLLKSFVAKVEQYHVRMCNRYGYRVLKGSLERGTQDGIKNAFKYYLIFKVIYSRRFATDCYSGYFDERLEESTVGLDGVDEYATEKATFAEMKKQNSYMVKNLLEGINNKNKKN